MCGLFREGVAVKYGQIESLRQQHPVAVMCRLLGVSESGYHAWRARPPSARAREESRLEAEIQAAHQRTRQTCGPERLQADLSDYGVQVGVHRIKRIRKKLGLRCRQKKKFKATTDSKHDLPIAPNHLDRQFAVTAPNAAWVTDITYIATDEGCRYQTAEQRTDPPFRPGQPVLRSRLPEPPQAVRHDPVDESQGQLLG